MNRKENYEFENKYKLMNMRRLFLVTLVLVLGFTAYSQQADSKLYDVYTLNQIENFRQNNPASIDYMNFYVNNVATIVDFPEGKQIETQQLFRIDPKTGTVLSDEITESDLMDFNPYLYNCKPANETNTYYTIGSTGKLLIMHSTQEMARKYKQYQKNNK